MPSVRDFLAAASRVDSGLVLWATRDPQRDTLHIVAAEMHRGCVFGTRYRACTYSLTGDEMARHREPMRLARQVGFRISQQFVLVHDER